VSTTSSDETQLAPALGISVSGGWGPVSVVVYWELVDIFTLVEHIDPKAPTSIMSLKPVLRGTIECVNAPALARRYSTPDGGVPAPYLPQA
jgi:hypothetical protein